MEQLIARSYARLIRAGRKTVHDVPESVLELVRAIIPEYFDEEEN